MILQGSTRAIPLAARRSAACRTHGFSLLARLRAGDGQYPSEMIKALRGLTRRRRIWHPTGAAENRWFTSAPRSAIRLPLVALAAKDGRFARSKAAGRLPGK